MKNVILSQQKQKELALAKLKENFHRKRAKAKSGKEFWAEPNFQKTTFPKDKVLGGPSMNRFDLQDGYYLLTREHDAFWRTGEYIVTYEVRYQFNKA